jgi:hypothetical protein
VWIECWMLCCCNEVLSRYQFERDFVVCVCSCLKRGILCFQCLFCLGCCIYVPIFLNFVVVVVVVGLLSDYHIGQLGVIQAFLHLDVISIPNIVSTFCVLLEFFSVGCMYS